MTTISNETFFDQPILSNIRLANIDYLSLKFPINDQFLSIIPNLNRLKSLSIHSSTNIFHSQSESLLDQAPHLHILSIYQDVSLTLSMSLFQ